MVSGRPVVGRLVPEPSVLADVVLGAVLLAPAVPPPRLLGHEELLPSFLEVVVPGPACLVCLLVGGGPRLVVLVSRSMRGAL